MIGIPAIILTLFLIAGGAAADGITRSPEYPAGEANSDSWEASTTAPDGDPQDGEGPRGDHGSDAGTGPGLFSEDSGEDPNITEIKRIARELESRRALMIKIDELQRELIVFAMTDAVAAHGSRIPSSICEFAMDPRFCVAMTASFRKRDVVIWKD